MLTTRAEPQIDSASYSWLHGIHEDAARLGDVGFKAIPINLLSRVKLGVQEPVGAKHKRFTVTWDILWTPVEVESSSNSW